MNEQNEVVEVVELVELTSEQLAGVAGGVLPDPFILGGGK